MLRVYQQYPIDSCSKNFRTTPMVRLYRELEGPIGPDMLGQHQVFRASGVTKAGKQPMEKADECSVFFCHEKTAQNPAL